MVLGLKAGRLTRGKALQAAEQAHRRLQMLAEGSEMAASQIPVVTRLFIRATQEQASEPVTPIGSSGSSGWPDPLFNLLGLNGDDARHWASAEHANPGWLSESVPTISQTDSYSVFLELRLVILCSLPCDLVDRRSYYSPSAFDLVVFIRHIHSS